MQHTCIPCAKFLHVVNEKASEFYMIKKT